MSLNNAVALFVGASGGVGRAIAFGLLGAGAEVLTGCGKSRFIGPRFGYNPRCVTRCGGRPDARLGHTKRRSVQLCELRGAGSKGSSAASDPADCGRGVGGVVAGIRRAVRQVWAAVDPARALASRPVVAGLLFGSLGAAADGTARIQSAVP